MLLWYLFIHLFTKKIRVTSHKCELCYTINHRFWELLCFNSLVCFVAGRQWDKVEVQRVTIRALLGSPYWSRRCILTVCSLEHLWPQLAHLKTLLSESVTLSLKVSFTRVEEIDELSALTRDDSLCWFSSETFKEYWFLLKGQVLPIMARLSRVLDVRKHQRQRPRKISSVWKLSNFPAICQRLSVQNEKTCSSPQTALLPLTNHLRDARLHPTQSKVTTIGSNW